MNVNCSVAIGSAALGPGGFNLNLGGNPGSGGSLVLSNLSGEVFYVDARYPNSITNELLANANNLDPIRGWADLTGNGHPLQNFSGSSQFIYFSSGGANNLPYCATTNLTSTSYLTNENFFNVSQPLVVFMVINDPSCCNADFDGALFDSAIPAFPLQMVSFHPDTGLTAMQLVAPNGVYLWYGNANNGSTDFGWTYGSWQVVAILFNGSSTQVFINGAGPLHTQIYGPNYAPGSDSCTGFFLANSTGSGFFLHTTPLTSPSVASFEAVIMASGSFWLDTTQIHAVEKLLGQAFNITIQ